MHIDIGRCVIDNIETIIGDILFYLGGRFYPDIVSNPEYLFQIIKDQKLNFIQQDICSELKDISVNTKYDTIILSNILEYISIPELLYKCRDNLDSLLKSDGEINSTN